MRQLYSKQTKHYVSYKRNPLKYVAFPLFIIPLKQLLQIVRFVWDVFQVIFKEVEMHVNSNKICMYK